MAPLRFFRRRRKISGGEGSAPASPARRVEPPIDDGVARRGPDAVPTATSPSLDGGLPDVEGAPPASGAQDGSNEQSDDATLVSGVSDASGALTSGGQGEMAEDAPADEQTPVAESPEEEPEPEVPLDPFELALEGWRAEVHELWDLSPLADGSRLKGSLLDLTHAHPSGIAQLFAGRPTRLTNLVREQGALVEARRAVQQVREQSAELAQRYGLAPLYLVVGVAQWAERTADSEEVRLAHAPVLMRPVQIHPLDALESDLEILLEPGLEVNPELAGALTRAGAAIDIEELVTMAVTEHGFTPRTALARVEEIGKGSLDEFELSERVYVGPFVHPGEILLEDLAAATELMADHPLVQALAGDLEAKRQLAVALPPTSPEDRSPDAERGVGDLDPAQHGAIELVAAGSHLILDARPGANTSAVLAAILADAAGSGRRVVYLPGTERVGRAVVRALEDQGIGELILDLHDPAWRTNVPTRIRLGLAPHKDSMDTEAILSNRAQLLAARSRLQGYMDALHRPREQWETSAHETLQHLADLATSTGPRTRVRLDRDAITRLDESTRAEASDKLTRLAILGGFSLRRTETPWFGANVRTGREASAALERTQILAEVVLPRVIEEAKRVCEETDLDAPESLRDWLEQLEMLRGVRESLDVFIPQVFERSAADMVIATATPAWREERAIKMPGGARRRLVKQAKDMVRPGVVVTDLHEGLSRIQRQREVWRRHCPSGGWPRLPNELGEAERSAMDAERLVKELSEVFPNDDLFGRPIEELRERLLELGTDPSALRYLPELNALTIQLENLGLGELVEDLRNRQTPSDRVAEELELSWWSSVLETIIQSDPVLAQEDGASLNALAEKFRELDRAHTETLGQPLLRAVDRRRGSVIAADKTTAQTLWQELADTHTPSLSQVRENYLELVCAARPIWVVPPLAFGQAMPVLRDIDLLIVDGAAHLPTSHSVAPIARARQVVFVGDATRTGGVLGELAGTLPTVQLPTDRARREEHIASFLAGHGYELDNSVPAPPSPSRMRLHLVEGYGMPTLGAVAVEGVQAEVDKVVELVKEYRGESLAVVSLSPITAAAIREAIARDPETRALLLGSDPLQIVEVDQTAGLSKDTIILSVGFGKTPHGRVLHRFGPVSSPEGLTMMVEALDSVRHNLEIVSCLAPSDLDSDRLHHAGAMLLSNLLDFASDAPPEPGSSKARSQPAVGEPDRLLHDLAKRLERLGLVVVPRYGFEGGVRIPLAVGHPSRPGELFVAVISDDEHYLSEPSLRRRDRHWVERLEDLGWIPHMAFSTAVFMDPQREARAIERKVELAMESSAAPQNVGSEDQTEAREPETASESVQDEPDAEHEAPESAQGEPEDKQEASESESAEPDAEQETPESAHEQPDADQDEEKSDGEERAAHAGPTQEPLWQEEVDHSAPTPDVP